MEAIRSAPLKQGKRAATVRFVHICQVTLGTQRYLVSATVANCLPDPWVRLLSVLAGVPRFGIRDRSELPARPGACIMWGRLSLNWSTALWTGLPQGPCRAAEVFEKSQNVRWFYPQGSDEP